MAAIRINPQTAFEFIGTAAERAALDTSGIGAGSTYWETDNKKGYIWDGNAWSAVTA